MSDVETTDPASGEGLTELATPTPTADSGRVRSTASDEPHVGGDSERSERSQPTSIKVTQTRSGIGTKPKQRGTLRALGLGRIGKTNTLPDRPEIRGMVAKVPHLVKVEEV
jgi:large subunit ribosomal protein L30